VRHPEAADKEEEGVVNLKHHARQTAGNRFTEQIERDIRWESALTAHITRDNGRNRLSRSALSSLLTAMGTEQIK
jgi:hypothetical protein